MDIDAERAYMKKCYIALVSEQLVLRGENVVLANRLERV
jgi:hypothetical protein